MAPPHDVRTLDDYLDWFDQQITWAGGEHVIEFDEIQANGLTVVNLQQQTVWIPDDFHMHVQMSIDSEMSLLGYGYHLMRGAAFVCRYDMHPGHEDAGGEREGLCHLHLPVPVPEGGELVVASPEVHIDDVIAVLHDTDA